MWAMRSLCASLNATIDVLFPSSIEYYISLFLDVSLRVDNRHPPLSARTTTF